MESTRHYSVSQLNAYRRCPHAYKLGRIDKEWQRPAAWLVQGSAVHEAIEALELSGREMSLEATQDVYREAFAKHTAKYTEITPNLEFWSWSGPYNGEADLERRFGLGLIQVERYFDWMAKHPEESIWAAEDGTLGIELEIDIDLDGVPVRGYIDQVLQDRVRDLKTGNQPGDVLQLATYRVAIKKQYGLEVDRGDYWMGKSGLATVAFDLTSWTEERITEEFHQLRDDVEAERFDPAPEASKCRFCDVSASCAFSLA